MGKIEITDEERQRRSELAKSLHAEGKFGGVQPGSGRPRKKRAAEVIAEQVADEAQTIFDRLMETVREGTASNAIAAIGKLIEIEEKEAARLDREDDKIDDMHRDQLLELVAQQMGELSKSGIIPGFADIIDAEIVEAIDQATS